MLSPEGSLSEPDPPTPSPSSLSTLSRGLWGWATQDAPELCSLVPTETSNGDLDSLPSAKVHDLDDIPSGVEIWRNSHVYETNLIKCIYKYSI